ncbi:MAG: RagB/SusD family nutrient uptake outer membrane protein, partial [Bacteroidota bacterium]
NGLPLMDNSSNSNPTADEPVDPRLDWTVGRDDVPYLNWGNHAASWIRDRGYSSEYSPKKLAEADGESSNVGWVANQLSPINVPLIRYADVVLMLAEIDVENGNLEAARAKVNRIRTRAGNCAQGADNIPVPIDDPSTAHATYSVGTYDAAWTDQGAAREAVRLERRLELAMEGHRFFDLKRYGEAYMISTMNAYFDVEETRRPFLTAHETIGSKHMLFPIPTAAVQLSAVEGNPTLRQNPGF